MFTIPVNLASVQNPSRAQLLQLVCSFWQLPFCERRGVPPLVPTNLIYQL